MGVYVGPAPGVTRKAFITGITGQDGSFLAEYLLSLGYYEVHGLIRRSSNFNTQRLDHIYKDRHDEDVKLFLHYGDLNDSSCISKLINEIRPDEVYNLGAQSHVRVSFDTPEYTFETVALGTLRILEAIRNLDYKARFYQASSSEQYGKVLETPQNEKTPFNPRSPYAVGKVAAHYLTVNYRESYDMYAVCGILFNHESERRGETFVTRKITKAACRIKLGLQDKLYLGNLDSKRDWGYAKDYVEAMWLMLQQIGPDDYVIATGKTRTVKEFLKAAFEYLELNWEDYVEIDSKYFRPTEVDILKGDASKAKKKLNWKPKTSFKELVKIMVDHDMAEAKRENSLVWDDSGSNTTNSGVTTTSWPEENS